MTDEERYRAALERIVFDRELNGLAGNPARWPSTVAMKALGFTFKHGKIYPPPQYIAQWAEYRAAVDHEQAEINRRK